MGKGSDLGNVELLLLWEGKNKEIKNVCECVSGDIKEL